MKMRKKGFLPSDMERLFQRILGEKIRIARFSGRTFKNSILSTCPKGGIVLDPFSGTGSTVHAAVLLERKGIGIDLSNQYTEIAKRRLQS